MEEDIRELIRRELPALVMQDPQIRDWVWHLIHDYAPSRADTESRFEKLLKELQAMRVDFQQEMRVMREEFQQEMRAMREESERKWEENQQIIQKLIRENERLDRRVEQKVSALGARWGISSESSFRNALRGILEESFGVKVERVEYRDESGEVFGQPDQVELDVIIHDGQVLVCEIKSAASRADIHSFNRKVLSYEKRINRTVDRKILISPFVLPRDEELARQLGIEVYSDAQEVQLD